jgi:hypothetical protein
MMNKQTRSDSYVCTLSTYDEQKIAAVREMVRQSNLLNRLANKRDRWGNPLRHKLKVRARLGRNSPYRSLYAQGGPLHRSSAQDIKREHGAYFDLYLHRSY